VKIGFPPRAIQGNPSDSLASCGIQNGDQLIVEESVYIPATAITERYGFPQVIEAQGAEAVQVADGFMVVRVSYRLILCMIVHVGALTICLIPPIVGNERRQFLFI
jgi:hypothetical protein